MQDTQIVANVSSALTTTTAISSTGIFYFINQNAGVIGLLISIIMGCATITYYIFSYKLNKRKVDFDNKIKLLELENKK